MMKQRDWTYRAFGPGYSRDKDTGRETEGREGQFQLAKGRAHRETDLAVALLGFASSPRNQAALKTARVTPRSESSRAAPSTTLHHSPGDQTKNMVPKSEIERRGTLKCHVTILSASEL